MKTKIFRSIYVICAMMMLFLLTTCRKDSECFDKELYEQHKDDFCTADCPGVTGCDGKFYCNECEANKKGIRIQ